MVTKRIKIITVGDHSCGKSSLVKRYCERRFDKRNVSTIGIDYGSMQVMVNGEKVFVDFFDSSGLAQFSEIRNEFFSDASAFVLVFDVSQIHSFERLQFWMKEVRRHATVEDWKTRIHVVGNKNDTVARQVDPQKGIRFVEKNKLCSYFDCSAMTGEGVKTLFEKMFEAAILHVEVK